MAQIKKKSDSANIKQIEQRWTKVVVGPGFTALPNIILDKQVALGLKPMDINIIMQIAKYWWGAGTSPFPAIDTIAAAIGVTGRTVQKHITAMEDKGLIERVKRYYAQGGQRSNAYTFQGLIDQCTPFAEEEIKERNKKKAADKARVRRKSPLHVVT